ncbi:AAA family ATPase [Cryobacterium sp. 5B3]|uniref:AAA family ATPase n=1 Tax=Cryobacterium sp. 5B3 TaxID=3048586 RepID=UPI002AB450E7|nr:AAA family ATPase [Cryobacterium sp. 5B3]MDY7541826.1 AAA family ATPase [Cryobacterium sp. 5B3]MEB0276350.1 AAA family ATPase [Cryobacterium sp. 5B3]
MKTLLKELRASGKDAPALSTYSGATIDSRFIQHLESLDNVQFDADVDLWFPEDRLQVLYRQEGAGNFKSIDEASPGQKTAALLAVILQLGDQPLILDQPEDDLDNLLIYDLVVKTLRKVKTKRQVLVVTHNANIVVNSDAELVTVLKHGPVPVIAQSGAIQDPAVREAICSIMEGGELAFEARYRRLVGQSR